MHHKLCLELSVLSTWWVPTHPPGLSSKRPALNAVSPLLHYVMAPRFYSLSHLPEFSVTDRCVSMPVYICGCLYPPWGLKPCLSCSPCYHLCLEELLVHSSGSINIIWLMKWLGENRVGLGDPARNYNSSRKFRAWTVSVLLKKHKNPKAEAVLGKVSCGQNHDLEYPPEIIDILSVSEQFSKCFLGNSSPARCSAKGKDQVDKRLNKLENQWIL